MQDMCTHLWFKKKMVAETCLGIKKFPTVLSQININCILFEITGPICCIGLVTRLFNYANLNVNFSLFLLNFTLNLAITCNNLVQKLESYLQSIIENMQSSNMKSEFRFHYPKSKAQFIFNLSSLNLRKSPFSLKYFL